jgi:phospholipid/cholesterol/gamma-HCH transport system substrate-binding protein
VRGQHSRRLPNWAIGLIAIVVVVIASFLAYTKQLPWHHGYQVKAVFSSAQNVRVKSPVRIAGVEVGEVTDVQPLTTDSPEYQAATGNQAPPGSGGPTGQQAAVVTMEISDEGRPIHEDATFKLRPRLFLEGNMFVDLSPGTPESPEADSDYTFPMSQTSYSVQLDQVLTTLQSDVRADLQTFLDQFGNALIKYKGAQGFRELYGGSAGAYKYTSQVNEALLGTEPHDLSNLIKHLDIVVKALDRNESQLKGLVSNFRIVSGSFAAQDQALEQAVAKLPDVLDAAKPAFASLNNAFPPLRAFAREALPGVRSTSPTLDAATPFINQLRHLVSKPELRGLVHDLRPTIPDLAELSQKTIPFLNQTRKLSSCFNEVVIPWSNDHVTGDPSNSSGNPDDPPGTVAEETAYGLAGIAGESRSGDANGQYIRVEAGGGTNTIVIPGASSDFGQDAFGVTPEPLLGAVPRPFGATADSVKTPFRPDVRCETQEPPNLDAGAGPPPQQQSNAAAQQSYLKSLQGLDLSSLEGLAGQVQHLTNQGKDQEAQAAQTKLLDELKQRVESNPATAQILQSLGQGGN